MEVETLDLSGGANKNSGPIDDLKTGGKNSNENSPEPKKEDKKPTPKKDKEPPKEEPKKRAKASRIEKDEKGAEKRKDYDLDDDDDIEIEEGKPVKFKEMKEYYSSKSKHEETEKTYKETSKKAKTYEDDDNEFKGIFEKSHEKPEDMIYHLSNKYGKNGADVYNAIEEKILKDIAAMHQEDLSPEQYQLKLMQSREARRKGYDEYSSKTKETREIKSKISSLSDQFNGRYGQKAEMAYKAMFDRYGDKLNTVPPERFFSEAEGFIKNSDALDHAEKMLRDYEDDLDVDFDEMHEKMARRILANDFADDDDMKSWLEKFTKSYRAKKREKELKK